MKLDCYHEVQLNVRRTDAMSKTHKICCTRSNKSDPYTDREIDNNM